MKILLISSSPRKEKSQSFLLAREVLRGCLNETQEGEAIHNQITASLKALFDRSSHFIHCKRLLGKYVAGVVASGSGQDKDVLNYIRYYAHCYI